MIHNRHIIKTFSCSLVLLIALITFSLKVEAETIFEGYYKVTLSGEHSGYVIQRYEFDAAKKLFTGSSFAYVKLSADGKQFLNESIVAKANDKFQPLSYTYSGLIASANPDTGRIENNITAIDATFNGQKMTLKGIKKGKNLASTTTIPKGAFLSNFLLHLILQNGLSVGKNFEFKAISEEEGIVQTGHAHIVAEEAFKGIGAYKMNWSFKDMKSVSYISHAGHALSTDSPAQKVSQILVANPSEATAGFTLPQQSIKKVFGNIPAGNVNDYVKTATPPKSSPAEGMTPPPAVIVKPPPTKGQ